MDRISVRAAISTMCAMAIGFLLAYATEVGLALCILMPMLCFLQKRRIHAFLVGFGYYGAASSILIPGILSFFGPGTTLQLAFALWGIAAFLLALPFFLLWSKDLSSASWRAPLAVLVSVPPPLGIIGWANPLTSAGILLPGMRWTGLIAVFMFAAFSPRYPRASVATVITAAVIANAVFRGVPAPPHDWEAVDTAFGDVSSRGSSLLKQYETAQYIQKRALESHARVIVFPESVVPRWSEATDLFWQPTLSRLAARGKILLVGAGYDVPNTEKYRNVIIIRGAQSSSVVQQIPVPIGMWQPFGDRGVPMDFRSSGLTSIGRVRVAVLICYEQFLTWPVLRSLTQKPVILVGVANHYWCNHTVVPSTQRKLLHSWARLFRISVLSAINS